MISSSNVPIVVSARMRSTRCPGKALAPLAGKPLLEHLLLRLSAVFGTGRVILATSRSKDNDPLVELAGSLEIGTYRGDEEDVLGRYVEIARLWDVEHVVRVTGDNPLTDLPLIERLVARHVQEDADYTYVPGDALLMGILSEVISRRALEASHRDGEPRHRSELVTLYIKENPEKFRIVRETLPESLYRPEYRLTVDEPEDLVLMERIFDRLYRPGRVLATEAAIRLLDEEPGLRAINEHIRHSAANVRSVALDGSARGE
ncbi:MAG TPA: NTP transferase domain-containing protein [Vicinamibacteria bacterium]|nr:NTP transferase domain-containing protein [Vicinamibacteria bacterium]